MKFAIADPPYIGQAKRHYGDHPDYGGEVDHAALIKRLVADYPDGWALCASSSSLQEVLTLCPRGVRICAWVKPWASWKPGIRVAYAWEPVVMQGGRKRSKERGTVRDWIAANANMRSRPGDKSGTKGWKPDAFCFWLFEVLGMLPEDTLDDLFPGSGAVTAAWAKWRRQLWSA